MLTRLIKTSLLTLAVFVFPAVSSAQWADSGVNVGPGFANGSASADGDWTLVDSGSHVNGNTSIGRGVAIGAGPDGISFSHSIGVSGNGVGAGHNFNMSIGRQGTHVSGGNVITQGGTPGVSIGGGSGNYPSGFGGGSYATGFGNFTSANTFSQTNRFPW